MRHLILITVLNFTCLFANALSIVEDNHENMAWFSTVHSRVFSQLYFELVNFNEVENIADFLTSDPVYARHYWRDKSQNNYEKEIQEIFATVCEQKEYFDDSILPSHLLYKIFIATPSEGDLTNISSTTLVGVLGITQGHRTYTFEYLTEEYQPSDEELDDMFEDRSVEDLIVENEIYLSIFIGKQFSNLGIATTSLENTIKFIQNNFKDVSKLVWETYRENIASQKVALRCGFEPTSDINYLLRFEYSLHLQ